MVVAALGVGLGLGFVPSPVNGTWPQLSARAGRRTGAGTRPERPRRLNEAAASTADYEPTVYTPPGNECPYLDDPGFHDLDDSHTMLE